MNNLIEIPALQDLKKVLTETRLVDIGLDELETYEWQPRKVFSEDSIATLAANIKKVGLLDNPLVWKSKEKDVYLLVGGERRWRAHKKLVADNHVEFNSIKCKVLSPDLTEDEVWEIAIIHNKDRENINPIDEALHMQKLVKTRGYSQEKLAEIYNVSRPKINEILKLTKLPEEIKTAYFAMVEDSRPASSLLRMIPKVKTKADMLSFWQQITEKKSTVKEAELILSRLKDKKKKVAAPKAKLATKPKDPRKILSEAQRLTTTLENNASTVASNAELQTELMELHKRIGVVIAAKPTRKSSKK